MTDLTPIIELLPALQAYLPALLVLAGLCVILMLQNLALPFVAFIPQEQVPGIPARFDHSRLSFRALRTHSNSVENLPPFAWSLMLAIVAGVSAGLVNWLAVIHFGFRLLFWAIYYAGVGRPAGGPRTFAFVGGFAANLILAGAAIWALLF